MSLRMLGRSAEARELAEQSLGMAEAMSSPG